MTNQIPLPTFIPHNAVEYQQLQLLHQIQNHAISTSQGPLLLLMFLPLPIEWRLAIYNFFSHLPLPHMSPILATVIILASPILTLTFLYFAIKFIIYLVKVFTPFVLTKFAKKEKEKKFLELTFPSDTSKSVYATEQLYTLLHTLARRKDGFLGIMFGAKKEYSLEIVSTKNDGIRFILAASPKNIDILKRSLLSFLPGLKIKETEDYLTNIPALNVKQEGTKDKDTHVGVVELSLSSDFVLPLQNQKTLSEHDFISYLTGAMTNLDKNELISFQIVITPVLQGSHNRAISHMQKLKFNMRKGLPIEPLLSSGFSFSVPSFILFILSPLVWLFVLVFKFILSVPSLLMDTSGKSVPILQSQPKIDPQLLLNPYEQELQTVVKEKIGQHLYETSIRILIVAKDKEELEARAEGIYSSFGPFTSPYQGLNTKGTFPRFLVSKNRLLRFRQRSVSGGLFSGKNPILSTSELSDIYHFPYTDTTKTEGLVKSRSRELPAPLSLKKSDANFDVIIGVNQYGGEIVPIGITLEQRLKHMYIIGKTGTGKTTLLTSSIFQDMVNGKGLAVLDPHGDMIQELLRVIPKNRRNDVIFFDPSDRDYPLGLNLLSPGITFSNEEDGHDWITSSVLTVFKKLSDEQYWGPRMEHILRNATLTALQTPNPNLYTLQQLLTDKNYQKKVATKLKDPVLKQFWQKEFALMGNMQISSITAPLTQRLGHFISSKMSRHILLQQKSTINISEIMDQGKILLVNLSKGDLGEDQSFFFGTILTSFIWMAAYQRTKIPEKKRKDFFVYVDEFQNFATPQFSEITSEGRKFHISLITSHQNIAQIEDKNILKIVAGNAHTIICLKASPDDEQFILPFMDPEVEKGDIVSLTPYHFFMKVTTDESEDAFSGKTVPIDVESSEKTKDEIIAYTRKHYATPRKVVEEYLEKLFAEDKPKSKKAKKGKEEISIKKTDTTKTKLKRKNNKAIKGKTTMVKKPTRRK